MKFAQSLAAFAVGVLGTFFLMLNMESPLPPVEYKDGFSFDMPCQEHGSHTQIVSGNRLVRLYEITVEGEVQGEVVAEQIAEVLEMIKLVSGPQVVPNGK